jgi:AcrR family transcriptional regulator
VVSAAADLADEIGFDALTMGLVAERVGVRTPSLYKHVDSLADLGRRIAVLAMTEVGDEIRDALQGRTGSDALAALADAYRGFVLKHPGRYAATIVQTNGGPDDPLTVAGRRVMASIAVVLQGYAIRPADMDHALRTLRSLFHGFATLQAANSFQWAADTDESFAWLVAFADRGLTALGADDH